MESMSALKRVVTTVFVLAGGWAMVNVLRPDDMALAQMTPLELVRVVVAALAGGTSLAVVWSLWRNKA
jgi:hypothetical protein